MDDTLSWICKVGQTSKRKVCRFLLGEGLLSLQTLVKVGNRFRRTRYLLVLLLLVGEKPGLHGLIGCICLLRRMLHPSGLGQLLQLHAREVWREGPRAPLLMRVEAGQPRSFKGGS